MAERSCIPGWKQGMAASIADRNKYFHLEFYACFSFPMALGAQLYVELLFQSACASERHIYNWKIVACDVQQLISLVPNISAKPKQMKSNMAYLQSNMYTERGFLFKKYVHGSYIWMQYSFKGKLFLRDPGLVSSNNLSNWVIKLWSVGLALWQEMSPMASIYHLMRPE